MITALLNTVMYISNIYLKNDVFRLLGELTAVSIVQGGSGLHLFNSSVYKYLCGNAVSAITPDVAEIPDKEIRDILEQVCDNVVLNT